MEVIGLAKGKVIGVSIKLDGADKYNADLKNASRNMRVLKSEMDLAKSSFAKNEKSVESLSAVNEVLGKTITEQKKRVSTLADALKETEDVYGKNSDEVKRMQIEYNKSVTNLNKLTREFEENKDAIEDLSKKMKDGSESIEDLNESLNRAESSINVFGEVLKANLASSAIEFGVNKIVGTISELGNACIDFAKDSSTAFNSLQVQTGATDTEMESLSSTMKEIYADNFGESMNDIANSMSIVQQQTGLTGDALKKCTEEAYLFQDSFDGDIQDSVKAVNVLMQKFGVTSTQAYSLLTQGVQKGLNSNQDMLDIITEYSNQFSQAGLSATDMFNMISNGAKTGSWSVDKMGDAFKEFSIRMNDGTVDEYLKQLNLDAKQLVTGFQTGGNSAKTSMATISKALSECNDETLKYQTGVGLFGTMWEDMGETACLALLNTQGEIENTTKALEAINNQRYDNIGSTLEGLKRKIISEIVEPLGEQAQPKIEEIIEYVNAHGDEIAEQIGNIGEVTGDLITFVVSHGDEIISLISGVGAGFVTWNVATMVSNVVGSIQKLKTATQGATTAQAAFNAIMASNPVGLIATGIAGITTALMTYMTISANSAEETVKLNDEYQSLLDTSRELNKESSNYNQTRNDLAGSLEEEAIQAEILTDKLFALQEQGNLTDGQQEVQKQLISDLNELYPELNFQIDETTGKYNMSRDAVNSFIDSAKNMAKVQALQEQYAEIAKDEAEAIQNKTKAEEELKEVTEKLSQAQIEHNKNRIDFNDDTKSVIKYQKQYDALKETIDNSEKTISNCNEEYSALDSAIEGYRKGANSATNATNSLSDAQVTSSEQVAKTKEAYEEAYSSIKDSIESAVDGFDKFDGGEKTSAKELQSNLDSQIKGIEEWNKNITSIAKRTNEEFAQWLADMGTNNAENVEAINSMTDEELEKYVQTWRDKQDAVAEASSDIMDSAYKTIADKQKTITVESGSNGVETGEHYASGIAIGIRNGQSYVDSAVDAITDEVDTRTRENLEIHSPSVKGKKLGDYYAQGFAEGISGGTGYIDSATKEISDSAVNGVRVNLEIHSPSVKAKMLGNNFGQGLANGIKSQKDNVKKSASELSDEILSAAEKKLSHYEILTNSTFSPKEQITYWTNIRKQLKKYSDAWYEATKHIQEARNEQKELAKESKELAEEQKANRKEIRADYRANLKEVRADLKSAIQDAWSTYKSESTALWESYANELASKTQSIFSQSNPFELFDSESNMSKYETADTLTAKLKSQVEGYKEFQDTMSSLTKKGLSEYIVDYLNDLGAEGGLEYAKLIDSMSSKQLQEYNSLLEQKHQLSSNMATSQLADLKADTEKQVSELKDSTLANIQTLTKEANAKIKEYFTEYNGALVEAGGKLDTTMEQFVTKVSDKGKVTITKTVKNMETASKSSASKTAVNNVATNTASTLSSTANLNKYKEAGLKAGNAYKAGLEQATYGLDLVSTNTSLQSKLTSNLISEEQMGTLVSGIQNGVKTSVNDIISQMNSEVYLDDTFIGMMKNSIKRDLS